MISQRFDPIKLINSVSEPKNNKKRDQSSNESINENVFDVFEELFFFEIVPTRKYHGW